MRFVSALRAFRNLFVVLFPGLRAGATSWRSAGPAKRSIRRFLRQKRHDLFAVR